MTRTSDHPRNRWSGEKKKVRSLLSLLVRLSLAARVCSTRRLLVCRPVETGVCWLAHPRRSGRWFPLSDGRQETGMGPGVRSSPEECGRLFATTGWCRPVGWAAACLLRLLPHSRFPPHRLQQLTTAGVGLRTEKRKPSVLAIDDQKTGRNCWAPQRVTVQLLCRKVHGISESCEFAYICFVPVVWVRYKTSFFKQSDVLKNEWLSDVLKAFLGGTIDPTAAYHL